MQNWKREWILIIFWENLSHLTLSESCETLHNNNILTYRDNSLSRIIFLPFCLLHTRKSDTVKIEQNGEWNIDKRRNYCGFKKFESRTSFSVTSTHCRGSRMPEKTCVSRMPESCKYIKWKLGNKIWSQHLSFCPFRTTFLSFLLVPSVAGQFAQPIAVKSATIHRYVQT